MRTGLFLGIETSGDSTGVALVEEQQTRAEFSESGANHNEVLPALIERALATAGARIEEIRGIGVTIGPGMFTGLRVGLSVTKGLALPHNITVKGVNTLLVLARTVYEVRGPDEPSETRSIQNPKSKIENQNSARPVLALIDARKHQVYYGLYVGNRPLLEPGVARPAELPGLLAGVLPPGRELLLAGSGGTLGEPELNRAGFRPLSTGVRLPSAVVVAHVAKESIVREGGDDLARLVPVYLRRTDAEMQREKPGSGCGA